MSACGERRGVSPPVGASTGGLTPNALKLRGVEIAGSHCEEKG
jgi:hypothetical protein